MIAAAASNVLFRTGPVYDANMSEPLPVVVNQGGTSSAKTYSILQVLFAKAAQYVRSSDSPTNIITVVGQDIPNLKRGALRQSLEIVRDSLVLQSLIKSYNKTDRVFEFWNGSIIEFNSYSDEQDAKSGKRDYLFINEANGISFEIYWQLQARTKYQTFVDYNPTAEFWAHERVIGTEGVRLIISDHRHNPFLTREQHRKIERITDPELWRVYARGMTGKIEGLVFRNWHISDVPVEAKLIGAGLDFGFTNDPTTLVMVYMSDGELYLDEILYQRGMTNTDISDFLDANEISKRLTIIADSADPKSIEELRRLGWNVQGADKGPDSINNGIDVLKRYDVNMTKSSINLRKETSSYKWKVDPVTGKPTNKPVDFMNHAIDAVRYVALNLLSEGKQLRKARFGFRKKKRNNN